MDGHYGYFIGCNLLNFCLFVSLDHIAHLDIVEVRNIQTAIQASHDLFRIVLETFQRA